MPEASARVNRGPSLRPRSDTRCARRAGKPHRSRAGSPLSTVPHLIIRGRHSCRPAIFRPLRLRSSTSCLRKPISGNLARLTPGEALQNVVFLADRRMQTSWTESESSGASFGKNPHLLRVQAQRHIVTDGEGPAPRAMGIVDQYDIIADTDGIAD